MLQYLFYKTGNVKIYSIYSFKLWLDIPEESKVI